MRTKKREISLLQFAKQRADQKRAIEKYSTAELYEVTANHFEQFLKGKACRPADLTITLVSDFAGYLQAKGLKRNSINSYLSSLRAIYNAAVADRLVPARMENPFRCYRFKREETSKRALPMNNLLQLAHHDMQDKQEQRLAVHLALFSFLAYGMPFIDIVHLKKSNLQGNTLCYQRHKTGITIRIGLTPGMRYFIELYSKPDSPYLFPMGQSAVGAPFPYATYKRLLAEHNRQLREVGEQLGFTRPLTSYVLRHTWASTALACEVPVALISQAMGHTSEKTTRCYLQQLDQSVLDQANARIIQGIEQLILSEGN